MQKQESGQVEQGGGGQMKTNKKMGRTTCGGVWKYEYNETKGRVDIGNSKELFRKYDSKLMYVACDVFKS